MPSDELVVRADYANATVDREADAAKDLDAAKALYDHCERVTADFQA